jgi:hypothetical protein
MKSEPAKGTEAVFNECAVSQDRCTDAWTRTERTLAEVLADVRRIPRARPSARQRHGDVMGATEWGIARSKSGRQLSPDATQLHNDERPFTSEESRVIPAAFQLPTASGE